MSKNWGMNFEGHVPTFGQRLPEGDYLLEIADTDHNSKDKNNKGNNVNFKYKVIDSHNGQEGSIASDRLYILDDQFTGSDGHAAATKDNWYYLLSATKMPLSNHNDMREVADAMIGRRFVATVVHTEDTNSLGEKKTYANFQNLRPAAAWGDSPTPTESGEVNTSETESDDGPSDEDVAAAQAVDLSDIE